MRHFWCRACGDEHEAGTRMVFPRSELGEPAEYERVTKGIALEPKASQRFIIINGEKQNLPLDHYNCDTCDAKVRAGEPAATWTVWTEEQEEPPLWENEWLKDAGVEK